jgi:hypothetical protein
MNYDITGLMLSGFIVILLFILSMVLRSGHGAFLINFYNIMSKERKAKYNEKGLCRIFGNLLLFADFIIVMEVIAALFNITWLIIFLTVILIIVAIGITIYAFTNERFRM